MSKKQKAFFPKRQAVSEPGRSDTETANDADGWVRRVLTAEFESDAQLGLGSGGGGVDALIARDRYGQPVIWASHVEGVLRDAARRLLGDKGAEGFFGRAGGDYARNDRQRAIFTSLYAEHNTEGHIWRSSAREAFDNRAPKDDTLRAVEYVPRGTKLVGEVELPASELPVLERLALEVDALGGGRSTGAGRVKLSLSKVSVEPPRKAGSSMGRLLLLLKNRDPLCITATATPDNLIPSLSFVPGRTLLGAVAAWLITEGHRETASLLTSGRVSVSDGLPLPQAPTKLDSVEVLPAPLTLQSEKAKGSAGEVPWWAQATSMTRRLDDWDPKQKTEKLKRPEDDLYVYRASRSEEWTTFLPSRRVRLRNGRPDPKQADASLFAIEQIVEETHFLAELRGSLEDMKNLSDKLGPILEGRRWLRVGRAGAPMEVVQLAWRGDATTENVSEKALLTLTSDLLVRDEYLRWYAELDEAGLRTLLGSNISVTKTDRGTIRALQDSVMVHGFNGTSRLWRMPAAAIRRGSIFEISGAGIAKLVQRVVSGEWLGERTHEGFGRFRLDPSLPGVTSEVGASNLPIQSDDVAEEPIAGRTHHLVEASIKRRADDVAEEPLAARTQDWFKKHKPLAETEKRDRDGRKPPSLSQWRDLVGDLERGDANALSNRINSTTAGGKSWKHGDATAILDELNKVQSTERTPCARLFVRWLRAGVRSHQRQGAR